MIAPLVKANKSAEASLAGRVRRLRDGSSLRRMKEYQAVILRLTRHTRDDEDALTDLLNERSRGGWSPALMTQDGAKLTLVFTRETDGEH
jgi:hypothetical protein